MIVVEMAIPQQLENNPETMNVLNEDLYMMLLMTGGKERTLAEFDHLAKAAGFTKMKVFPMPHGSVHVIEFHK